MISKEDANTRAVLQINAESGCPAVAGKEVIGHSGDNGMNCQGENHPACQRCQIRGRFTEFQKRG